MFRGGTATIWVTDHARAVRFYRDALGSTATRSGLPRRARVYRDALGLPLERHVPGEWAVFRLPDGFALALHPARPGSTTMRPGDRGATEVGLEVDGRMEDAVAALRARGVAFHGEIVESPPVRLAFLSDPGGNALYLYERV